MDKSAQLYYNSALALGLPTQVLPELTGFEVKLGKHRYHFRGGDTPFNRGCAVGIASNKYCTNKLLERAGLPVPNADVVHYEYYSELAVTELMERLTFPVVIKPTAGTALGLDVICNIPDLDMLNTCLKKTFTRHEYLSIEEYHADLNSYRVLIFRNKVIGVVQRFSARVVGDGVHSIEELIEIENQTREVLSKTVTLGRICVDDESLMLLRELSMTVHSIPKDQEVIILCYTCNASRGGTMESLGKQISKKNAKLLCHAANVLGLTYVGFDVNCHDLFTPIAQSGGVIIEANYNPDVSIHEHPLMGVPNKVSKVLLRSLAIKHPVAYLMHVCKTRCGVYMRALMSITLFFSCKLWFVPIFCLV